VVRGPWCVVRGAWGVGLGGLGVVRAKSTAVTGRRRRRRDTHRIYLLSSTCIMVSHGISRDRSQHHVCGRRVTWDVGVYVTRIWGVESSGEHRYEQANGRSVRTGERAKWWACAVRSSARLLVSFARIVQIARFRARDIRPFAATTPSCRDISPGRLAVACLFASTNCLRSSPTPATVQAGRLRSSGMVAFVVAGFGTSCRIRTLPERTSVSTTKTRHVTEERVRPRAHRAGRRPGAAVAVGMRSHREISPLRLSCLRLCTNRNCTRSLWTAATVQARRLRSSRGDLVGGQWVGTSKAVTRRRRRRRDTRRIHLLPSPRIMISHEISRDRTQHHARSRRVT